MAGPFKLKLQYFTPSVSFWPAATLGVLFAMQIWIAFTRAINWDEFYFYSQIYSFLRGELSAPLQTFHVRLFWWLPSLPGNGVDHIIVGRTIMLLCEVASCLGIALLAGHFTDRRAGLLCAAFYMSGGFVMRHGFSFRTDPVAAAILISSLAILARAKLKVGAIVGFAVLVAVAGMVTMKAALYLPAFAGLALYRSVDARWSIDVILRLCAAALLAVACFGGLYLWHSATLASGSLPSVSAAGAVSTASSLGESKAYRILAEAGRMLDPAGFRYAGYLRSFALLSLPLAAAMLIAPFAIWRAHLTASTKIALGGLLSTALVFLFYRNTLPYWYPYILPPIVAGCAISIRTISQRYSMIAISLALSLNGLFIVATDGESRIDRQRKVVDAAEIIFPDQPVSYFDFPAMLGNMRKQNVFMTLWGVEGYLEQGIPKYAKAMEATPVPLLLANDPSFNPSISDMLIDGPNAWTFLKEDRQTLRDTYIPFWGPYWLAGETIAPGVANEREIRVPGDYTITGGPLAINAKTYNKGEIVSLDRGVHVFENRGQQPSGIIWGRNPKRPEYPPPPRPYWTDF